MKIMITKITLNALAAVFGLGLASDASAKQPPQKPVKTVQVVPCSMDDFRLWSHWAAAVRGYEHMINGDFGNAAACYQKASQMYGIGSDWKIAGKRSLVCDAYTRISEILHDLPKNAINLRERETFEESAQKALKSGNKPLAAKLFELTALGWYVDPQSIGRFEYEPLHREGSSWQDGYLRGGHFMEVAAGLVTGDTEKRRLLGLGRDITAVMLDTEYSSSSDYQVRHGGDPYPECKQAQDTIAHLDDTIARLDTTLKK